MEKIVKLDDLKAISAGDMNNVKDKTFLIVFKAGKNIESRKVNLIGFDINNKRNRTFFFKWAEVSFTLEHRVYKYDQEHKGQTPLMFAIKEADILECYTSEKLTKCEMEASMQTATFLSNRMLSRIDWAKMDNDRLARDGKLITGEVNEVTRKEINA